MTKKVERRQDDTHVGTIYNKKNPSLREIGTVQVRQVLRCVLAAPWYATKDIHINVVFKGTINPRVLTGGYA